MAIRVAYHTITWGQQNFLQALDEITALGFQGFETFAGVADQFGDRVSEFKDLLAQRGLRLVTVYGGGPMNEAHRMDEVIAHNVSYAKFLAANGAGRLVLGGGSRRSAKPSLDDLRNQAHCMNEIGRRCLDLGVLACYHPHYATTVETPDEIDWMMEHTDPRYVFLGPDTAHLRKGKGDEVAIIRTYAERVRYVHFKDWDPNAFQQAQQARATGAEAATAILPDFVELGTGVVKVKECFQVLKDRGYDGWITIELDRSRTTPKDSATKNKLFVEKELGLKVG
jgi:inosose dehydratase